MAEDLFFKKENWLKKRSANINTAKALDFVSALINQPQKLLGTVDWYESKIQKAKDLLLAARFTTIDTDWDKLMRSLLQEQYFSFKTVQIEDKKIISNLIEYLKIKLNEKQITPTNILEAMIVPHYQKFFVSRVGLMKKLENLINSYTVSISRENKLFHELNNFKVNYVWAWFNYYMHLIEFSSKNKVNWPDSINLWLDDYFRQPCSTEEVIDKAIDEICSICGLHYTDNEGAIRRLNDLTMYLCDRCSESEEYPEIAYNLSYIKCAVGEIKSWIKIEQTVIGDVVKLEEIDISDICQCISYFEKEPDNSRETMNLFDKFMMSLEKRTLEDTSENREMIQKLHELLSNYLQHNQMNYTQYRRILCNLEKRMTSNSEADEPEV